MLIKPIIPKGDSRYAMSSGVVRGLERKLMGKNDYLKLIDIEWEDVSQFLSEFGYKAESVNSLNFDDDIQSLQIFLDKHSLDKDFTGLYRLRWDYRSAAVALKKHLTKQKFSKKDVNIWGNYSYEDFQAELNGERNELPEMLKKSMKEAIADFEREKKIFRVDSILDRDYLQFFYRNIPAKNEYLNKYYKVTADYLNMNSALRFFEMEYKFGHFEEFYIEFGFVPRDFYKIMWDYERSGMTARFVHTPYGKELYDELSLAIHHKDFSYFDDYFKKVKSNILGESIYSTFGLEVILFYFEKKKLEIETLGMLLKSKSANLPQDVLQKAVANVFV